MNIQVTGHEGMLGKEVCAAVVRYGHKVIVEDVDITDMPGRALDFHVMINCAGLVPQRDPSPSASRMMFVNGYGPHHLAEWCERAGGRLIHVSTDCVFDKLEDGPHGEMKFPRPLTPYGKSKLAGEVTYKPHLTVRTSFVGFGKWGLISELYDRAHDEKEYLASARLLWTGHTSRYVAEMLVILAERQIEGLIHIPGEEMTRNQLVRKLRKALDMIELEVYSAGSPDIDRRLKSDRWEKLKLPAPPSFDWQLEWLRRSYLSAL